MRKLIVYMNSTANDIVTGPTSGDETDLVWSQAGSDDSLAMDDLLDTFRKTLVNVDTILLGRATYQDLVRKWPKVKEWPEVTDVILGIGEKINTTPKVVATGQHPLDSLAWGDYEPPTQLTGTTIEEQIKELKKGEGGDIFIIGSPTLVQSLTNAGLVDEYQLVIYPVIMHEGKHLFENLKGRIDLQLIGVTPFEKGAILIKYPPRSAN